MIWVRKDLFEQVIISMSYNIRKISKVWSTKALPYIGLLRRMKAAKRCLSLAEVNPHHYQALAAYNSLAMITPRKTTKKTMNYVAT